MERKTKIKFTNFECNLLINGMENDKLYKTIFKFVTNNILTKGALPFDDLQHGEYAKTHGNFTSTDLGYTITNRRFDIV